MSMTFIDAHAAGASTSAAVTAPDGIANNDLLIGCAVSHKTTEPAAAITAPSGFTSILSNEWTNSSNYWRRIEMFWKRASSESGNYTFSASGTAVLVAGVLVLRGGLLSGDPTDVSSDGNYNTNDAIVRADTMTTTVSGAQVWCGIVNFTTAGLAVPAAFTEGVHLAYATNWGFTIGYRLDSAEAIWGATDNQEGTGDGATTSKRAMMASFKQEPTFVGFTVYHASA